LTWNQGLNKSTCPINLLRANVVINRALSPLSDFAVEW